MRHGASQRLIRRSGRTRSILTIASAIAMMMGSGCGDSGGDGSSTSGDEFFAGGDTTVFTATSNAFSTPAPNLTDQSLELHLAGDAAFEAVFVSAPAIVNPGLGPLFNQTNCIACHPKDGRGRPPADGDLLDSMLVRTNIGSDPVNGPMSTPGFGTQLQNRAIFGVPPEVRIAVTYEETEEFFADGESYSLRTPELVFTDGYLPFPADAAFSPRIGPPVFGRGLLEAIPDSSILRNADEEDRDGDGISGKPNYVWDVVKRGSAIGRFGLKAGAPTVLQQVAGAYVEDMGVTSSVFSVESAENQPQDDRRGDDPELPDSELLATTFYVQTLGVPARRNVDDPQVRRGREVFDAAQCAACHIPNMRSGKGIGVAEVAHQDFWPYTDLLLHDMGEGLADGLAEFEATGREWKTPPLWGIGLSVVVNGHSLFLHDGRARNLIEAIMWHGGEAAAAREMVRTMDANDRAALIAFLESL